MNNISTLRAVATRLISTPIEDLPHQVRYLATSIASCQGLLQTASPNNDHATLLHKLKTRISALLQDRTPEGRFCGIVIAKAIVEAGSTTILPDSGNWVRAIISCLNKSDSAEVRKLGVLTVTRIYLLTHDYQQLVREITTPTLPAFISATLSIIRPSTITIEGKVVRALSPLLEAVLRSWDVLIEHFPSTIRPSASSIKSICLSLVSDDACSANVQEAAQDVLAKLHFCAPKNTAAAEWSQSCSQIIEAAHDTADLVLRAVIEDWSSSTTRTSKITRKQKYASIPSNTTTDAAGFDPWAGVSQGFTRIKSHVELLQRFFTNCHSSDINVPLGAIFDLTSRLSAITVPSVKFTPRANNDITRDEREELWLNLPRIHTSILQLYQAMVLTFGQALFPLCNIISSQIWDIFEAEHEHDTIRSETYSLITSMLESRLLNFSKSDSVNFKLLIKCCCDDLRPLRSLPMSQLSMTNGNSGSKSSSNGTTQSNDLGNPKRKRPTTSSTQTDLYSSAYALLPALLTYANLHLLEGSSTIRAQLDSTAILLNHHEAILSSVLYPPNSRGFGQGKKQKGITPNLLPFLARSMEDGGNTNMSSAERLGYEALLRPRMPIIPTTTSVLNATTEGEDQEDDFTDDGGDAIMLDRDLQHNWNSDQNQRSQSLQPRNPDTEVNLSNTKRDFTALLEQSANEQLAASAAENTSTTNPPISTNTLTPTSLMTETSAPKRQKTSDEPLVHKQPTIKTQNGHTTTVPVNPVNHGDLIQSTATTSTSTSTRQNADLAPSTTQPRQQFTQASKAVEADDFDTNSDSDIPLIDATLVGISDSEDESDVEGKDKEDE